MIGGNVTAIIQSRKVVGYDAYGEGVVEWTDLMELHGWLDLAGGTSTMANNALMQNTTHVFVADWVEVPTIPNRSRMVVGGNVYDIDLIDDPMGMHRQLEIYLSYVGGGSNEQ